MAKAKVEVVIDPAVQKAMDEHGDCAPFKVAGKLFVFRPLELDEYESFEARVRKKDAEPGPINRECCQVALVHGALPDLQNAFEKAPGFSSVASAAIMQMSFSGIEVVVKKG